MNVKTTCPECGEPARAEHPTTWDYRWGPAPDFAHLDGEPLCPVIGDTGYEPADAVAGDTPADPGSPAQRGHAGFPTAADKAAGRIVDRLARDIGHRAAVAWVHAGAVLWWADSHQIAAGAGPAADAAGIRDGLKRLTDTHPALADFTDPSAVALWEHGISDTDAEAIRDLWAEHPPADPAHRPHGYLLGNAYQALSEESRKHRALAQTPRYITDLLLALAWQPAVDVHRGLDGFRMIDPSCGTGHILIEALARAATWAPAGSTAATPTSVELALHTVHGVDLDPYAALIARLRLVVMARHLACRAQPDTDWPVQVAAADALLDRDEPLLQRGQYHAVVANPPYVTPKTAEQRDAVRAAYPEVCHMKYALGLPFHALSNDLLLPGGWCAQLTANSFMKREFGKRYIEKYLSRHDTQWIIDSSGCYIPGHGTPTVILANRNRAPVGDTVSTVLGNRGEPKAPEDPSRGLVWRALEEAVYPKLARQRLEGDQEGGQSDTPAARPAEQQAITEQLQLFADEAAA